MTPNQRTTAYLRNLGYMVGTVEKWVEFTGADGKPFKQRSDLWNFADLIAARTGEVLLVQATSGSNTASRVAKIQGNEHARRWLEFGHRIEVHGWRQLVWRKKDGQKAAKKRWEPNIVDVKLVETPF